MLLPRIIAENFSAHDYQTIQSELLQYRHVALSYGFLTRSIQLLRSLKSTLFDMGAHPLLVFTQSMRTPIAIKKWLYQRQEMTISLPIRQIVSPTILIRNFIRSGPRSRILVLSPSYIKRISGQTFTSLYADTRYWNSSLSRNQFEIFDSHSAHQPSANLIILNSDHAEVSFKQEDIHLLEKQITEFPKTTVLCSNLKNAQTILKKYLGQELSSVLSFGPDSSLYWESFYRQYSELIQLNRIVWMGDERDSFFPEGFPIPQINIQ